MAGRRWASGFLRRWPPSSVLPDRTVACVTGDGGFLMMVGEMATAARLGLPVVFVVLTDRNLQLIKVKQERRGYPQYGTALYTDAYQPAPQYFGVPVITANDAHAFHEAFAMALTMSGPVIVEAWSTRMSMTR